MNKKLTLFFPLVLLLAHTAINAQDTSDHIINTSLRNYGLIAHSWNANNGLPDDQIYDFIKDKEGFLWIATNQGLVRFDGSEYRVFNDQNIPVLKESSYSNLIFDSEKNLYFLNGSRIIKKSRDNIFSLITPKPVDSGLFFGFVIDSSGAFWLGTRTNGLYKLEDHQYVHVDSSSGMNAINISYLTIDRNNELWVCAGDRGVYKYKNGKFNLLIDKSKIPGRRVISLFVDSFNRLWIGTNEGLLLFKNIKEHSKLITRKKIHYISEDSDHNLWLGTIKEGILIYHNGKLLKYTAENELSDNGITKIAIYGNDIWVGTNKGGINLIRKSRIFSIGKKEGLLEDYVNSVYEDKDGSILIGTTGGLYKLREPLSNQPLIKINKLNDEYIFAIKRNRSGDLIIGTRYNGLYILKKNKIINYNLSNGLKTNFVRCVFVDDDGSIWIGTNGEGISILKDGKIRHLTRNNGLSYNLISFIHKTIDGKIWIGTTGGGVNVIDKKGNIKIIDKSNGLPGNLVSAIYEEPNGNIWLTINRGGVTLIKENKIYNFSTSDGLYSNIIFNIVYDRDNTFWFPTTKGIFSVKKTEFYNYAAGKTKQISYRHFDESDGMIAKSCVGSSPQTTALTKNGLALFSTVKGVVVITPSLLDESKEEASLYFDHILVNNKPFNLNKVKTLDPNPERIEFFFGAINFQNSKKLNFKCQLSGIDKNWIELGKGKSVGYSHLPYGNYKFRLVSYDPGNNVELASTEINFFVTPYFWETFYFQFFSALSLIIILILITRYINKRKYEKRIKTLEAEKALEKERTRISTDMHDELGAGLTKVSILLGMAKENFKINPEQNEHIQKIIDAANDIEDTMDEIIWSVDPKYDNFRELVNFVTNYAQTYFEDTDIKSRFDIPIEIPDYPLTVEQRHQILSIIKEAFTNVVKHSDANEVILKVKDFDNEFELQIKDNGKGFEPGGKGSMCHGLDNMEKRSKSLGLILNIETKQGTGTTIKLSIPK